MELHEMGYMRLIQFAPAKNVPFSGVLVRFRKKKQTPSTRAHFRMRVDHILVYDAALSPPSATILRYFGGVYHDKPQIVLLVMLQSVDMRFCHFRDDHPHIIINPGKPLIEDKQGLSKLIENPKYKKITMVQRIGHNTAMLQRLIQWMVVRDGTVFDANNPINDTSTAQEPQLQKSVQDGAVVGESSTKAIIITPTISPGIKRSIAETLDEQNKRMKVESKEENTLVVPSTVNTESFPSTIPNTEHASAVEAESAGTAEEALCNGMFEFESALDEEYEKLKRLIYG
jgi:hypothetical protein